MSFETADRPAAESYVRAPMATRGSDAAFVTPDQVPDIAIDGFEGALSVNGLLRLNLIRFRMLPGANKTVREVVGTLTMAHDTATSFAAALVDALNRHRVGSEDTSPATRVALAETESVP